MIFLKLIGKLLAAIGHKPKVEDKIKSREWKTGKRKEEG